MSGKIEIGFNNDYFLFSHGLINTNEVKRSLMARSNSNFLKEMNSTKSMVIGDPKKANKFKYPVRVAPGQIIGMYEILFNQQSQFIYKPDMETSHIDAFFIRRVNLKRILKENKNLGDLNEKFHKFILLDYVKRVYLPIQKYQDREIDKENHRRIIEANPTLLGASVPSKDARKKSIFDPFFKPFTRKEEAKEGEAPSTLSPGPTSQKTRAVKGSIIMMLKNEGSSKDLANLASSLKRISQSSNKRGS
eukprot:CAMPEP_0170509704 /NCGR_PEP_ID=MMETSP0208-20121228/65361_1 /TAXON_ID=197538 /ORGANISM="Strombidium inclinatum, Strain S3" /LENGTH=247 /DNA_ID=CAMNT_0010793087 /DNA_START=782 /DNA_END=1525 /DNA_ORIENTATION=-